MNIIEGIALESKLAEEGGSHADYHKQVGDWLTRLLTDETDNDRLRELLRELEVEE